MYICDVHCRILFAFLLYLKRQEDWSIIIDRLLVLFNRESELIIVLPKSSEALGIHVVPEFDSTNRYDYMLHVIYSYIS